jgi:hypothetical protein
MRGSGALEALSGSQSSLGCLTVVVPACKHDTLQYELILFHAASAGLAQSAHVLKHATSATTHDAPLWVSN